MRVAKRSRPGSYRRMRIPNASPSPPKTRATTSTSGAPLFTISVTPPGGASSRRSKGFPHRGQKRRRSDTGAGHGAGERLERGLGAPPIRRVVGHPCQVSKEQRDLRIGTGEYVVEEVLGPISGRGQ